MATLYTISWIIAGTLETATVGTRHGTRYTVYTLDKKQSGARDFCEERGDHLPSFQSEEKLNRFLEIRKPWLSKQLLTNSFWVSLKKDSSSFLWHDRTEYKDDDYSNLTMKVNQSEKQCFVFSQDGNRFDLIEKDCFDKTYQVICERDLFFPDTKYRSNANIMKTDVGNFELETCQRLCLDHSVSGEECIGVERDGNGTCELLHTFSNISLKTAPTYAESGTTLSTKRCYEEHFGGNPSQATMFTLYSFKLTWHQTRTFCEYNKQRMIQLDSPTKLSAFNNSNKQWVDRELLFSSIWIGLRDTNTSGLGAYNWTDEQPISAVTRWGHKEPRQSNTEQCIFLSRKNRRWKSAVCSRRFQVACEHSTVKELPYTQQKTILSSSLIEENSSNLEPTTHSFLMGQPEDTAIVVTGSSVVAGASVVTGSSVIAGASVVTGSSRVAGPSEVAGPSVVAGASVVAGPSVVASESVVVGPSEVVGSSVVAGASEIAGSSAVAGASVKTVSSGPTDVATNIVIGGTTSNSFWINEKGRIVRSVCVCRCRVQLPDTAVDVGKDKGPSGGSDCDEEQRIILPPFQDLCRKLEGNSGCSRKRTGHQYFGHNVCYSSYSGLR